MDVESFFKNEMKSFPQTEKENVFYKQTAEMKEKGGNFQV